MADDKPEKSGVAIYVVLALALAAGIIGIVVMTGKEDPKPTAKTTPAVVTEEAPINNPPPPPPPKKTEEPEDAGDDADAADGDDAAPTSSAKVASTGTGSGGGGACGKCGEGKGNSALSSKLSAAAGSARSCYNKAINRQGSAAEGKMTVRVNVGSTGGVCSASIANDTVGNPAVSNCVLQAFQGKQFPPPDEGCVTVNIPLNFAVKKD